MSKFLTSFISGALVALATLILNLSVVRADSLSAIPSDEACVAVFPCDQEGNVIPPYNSAEGYCGELFRRQCDSVKANIVAEKLIACEADKNKNRLESAREIRKLRKELRKVRK